MLFFSGLSISNIDDAGHPSVHVSGRIVSGRTSGRNPPPADPLNTDLLFVAHLLAGENDGQARAKDLAAAVADAHVSTVIATQFVRTQATAKPVADAAGKTTIIVPATADPKAHADSVAAKVRAAPAGSAVLVVGHSNTIPLIIAALGGPKMQDLCDAEYSNMFVMQMAGGGSPRLVRAKYGVSDPMGSEKCTRPMKK